MGPTADKPIRRHHPLLALVHQINIRPAPRTKTWDGTSVSELRTNRVVNSARPINYWTNVQLGGCVY